MSDSVEKRSRRFRPLQWHPVHTEAWVVKGDHTPEECDRAYLDMQAARAAPLLRELFELRRQLWLWRRLAFCTGGFCIGQLIGLVIITLWPPR